MADTPTTANPVILIADDDASLSELLVLGLKDTGYQVVRTGTGAEALQAIAAHPPHVLILDYRLPDMSGLEVLRRLRTTDAGKTLPVIVASNTYEVDLVNELMELGVSDYVLKADISLELIIKMVGDHVGVSPKAD